MKRDSLLLAGFATFLLTSLLILSACGRQNSDSSGIPNGLQQDYSSYGQDYTGMPYQDGEVPLNDPTMAPNSSGQDQPSIPGLTENNATNGPMNLPLDDPSGQDYAQAMQPLQQLFANMPTLEPTNLPQPIQNVLKQWWCLAAQQQRFITSYSAGASAYDIVTGHYLDLLGRFPEPAGHQHWMNHLLSHGQRSVSLGILRSQEFAHRKAREWAWHFLRVTPSQATLNNVHNLMKNQKDRAHPGSVYTGEWLYTMEEAIIRFMSQFEGNLFWNRARAAANHQVPLKYQEYARRVMQALLGRNPALWEVENLRNGKNYHSQYHRRQTAIDVIRSDEYRLKFITGIIRVFLNRAATPTDYAYLMDRFRQGYDMMSVMADVLGQTSAPYYGQQYAQRQFNRFNPLANQCGG